jgi:hypothetical protein
LSKEIRQIGWKPFPFIARLGPVWATLDWEMGSAHAKPGQSGFQRLIKLKDDVLDRARAVDNRSAGDVLQCLDNLFDTSPQTIRRANTNNLSFNNWTTSRVIKLGSARRSE